MSSSSNNSSIKYPFTPKVNYDDVAQLSSSTSQIFATASQFNISQNVFYLNIFYKLKKKDTVVYSRETMHLLAKFLAQNSDNQIFKSLYAFAPDNLAWLWAFLDWETPIDLNKIPSQDQYQTFKPIDDRISEDKIQMINKIFFDAPLVQYSYRGLNK